MTTSESDSRLRDGIRAAMQLLKERQTRHEYAAEHIGPDEATGQLRQGLADGYGESIGILEEMTGVSAGGLKVPDRPENTQSGAWVSELADDFIKELEDMEP